MKQTGPIIIESAPPNKPTKHKVKMKSAYSYKAGTDKVFAQCVIGFGGAVNAPKISGPRMTNASNKGSRILKDYSVKFTSQWFPELGCL